MDPRSRVTVAAALGALLCSGCLAFDDLSHLEGHCFDWAAERYVLCDAGAPGADATTHEDAAILDAAPDDVGVVFDGGLDAGVVDAAPGDATLDAGVTDTGLVDTGVHADATVVDTGPTDSGLHPDADLPDLGTPDVGVPIDAGFPDTGAAPDAGFLDTGVPPDAGFPDTGILPDAGFPFEATLSFTGPGRGHVWTESYSVGSGQLHSLDCRYDGVAQTLRCDELVGGVAAGVYVDTIGASPSFSVGFQNANRALSLFGRGVSGGTFSGFTGACVQPPPVSNACRLGYPAPPTPGQSATVRFD